MHAPRPALAVLVMICCSIGATGCGGDDAAPAQPATPQAAGTPAADPNAAAQGQQVGQQQTAPPAAKPLPKLDLDDARTAGGGSSNSGSSGQAAPATQSSGSSFKKPEPTVTTLSSCGGGTISRAVFSKELKRNKTITLDQVESQCGPKSPYKADPSVKNCWDWKSSPGVVSLCTSADGQHFNSWSWYNGTSEIESAFSTS